MNKTQKVLMNRILAVSLGLFLTLGLVTIPNRIIARAEGTVEYKVHFYLGDGGVFSGNFGTDDDGNPISITLTGNVGEYALGVAETDFISVEEPVPDVTPVNHEALVAAIDRIAVQIPFPDLTEDQRKDWKSYYTLYEDEQSPGGRYNKLNTKGTMLLKPADNADVKLYFVKKGTPEQKIKNLVIYSAWIDPNVADDPGTTYSDLNDIKTKSTKAGNYWEAAPTNFTLTYTDSKGTEHTEPLKLGVNKDTGSLGLKGLDIKEDSIVTLTFSDTEDVTFESQQSAIIEDDDYNFLTEYATDGYRYKYSLKFRWGAFDPDIHNDELHIILYYNRPADDPEPPKPTEQPKPTEESKPSDTRPTEKVVIPPVYIPSHGVYRDPKTVPVKVEVAVQTPQQQSLQVPATGESTQMQQISIVLLLLASVVVFVKRKIS